MTDDDMNFTAASQGEAAAIAPFRPTVSRYYDATVAAAFFEQSGKAETITAGTVLFAENDKSVTKGILTQPLSKALFKNPLSEGLFTKSNAHRMYFLSDGEVEITAGGKTIDTIKPGGVFGEMAVISEMPGDTKPAPAARSATATARTDCKGWSMDVAQAEAGLTKTPEFCLMLMSVMFERLRFLAARLTANAGEGQHVSKQSEPVFDAATVAALEEKLERATIVRFSEGQKIMREGQSGTSMYIVVEGRVTVGINKQIVEKLSPGGVFGEIALVDQAPRIATAVARTDCALLSLNRGTLISLVKSDPAIGMAMMRGVAERVRYMNSLFA